MRNRKLREWISVHVAKSPRKVVLAVILLFNLLLILLTSVVVSALAPSSLKEAGFWPSVYYTISMILDAGSVSNVVEDVGTASVALIITCLVAVIIGMVTFTGAMVGYMTNTISNFIENANTGNGRLLVSGHTIILNWNNRASEIVNDMLYSDEDEKIIILVDEGRERVEREIRDRLADTLAKNHKEVEAACADMPYVQRVQYRRRNRLKNRLTVLVREGDTFSTKQLHDISVQQAKCVIILSRDFQNTTCKYDFEEQIARRENGDTLTIKTLVQVAELTAAEESADDQRIVVEVEDKWTLELVNKIIEHKERLKKCNITVVAVNRILGQILSQFSIMPELNLVYSELFSNRGATFYCEQSPIPENDEVALGEYFKTHVRAIPVTHMDTKTGPHAFFVSEHESDLGAVGDPDSGAYEFKVKMKDGYWLERRNVVILGHNSKSKAIMDGFDAFRDEWNFADGSEILNIIIVDDKKSLEKNNYYRDYPYVNHVVEADIFDKDLICDTINAFIDAHEEDTSVLILSDDNATSDNLDAAALTYLIYLNDIIAQRIKENPDFDRGKVDIVVEILNPKNYDVVHSYNVNNVVISNRYISKVVTQLGEKSALFEFYNDILTYDGAGCQSYQSKELYVKKVSRFFDECPGPCTAAELIRAVYDATPWDNKSVVLGYVRGGNQITLFAGDQNKIEVALQPTDKIIVFSNH